MLLIVLFMLAGQKTIPQFFSNFLPAEAECIALRSPSESDRHQSLIQRAASERMVPIRARVRIGDVNGDGSRTISVILTNMTVGTLPIHIPNNPIGNPSVQLNVDSGSGDGIGILLDSTFAQTTLPDTRAAITENQVRLLAPLQSCAISQTFPSTFAGISPGRAITGYYRNSTSGVINQRTPQSIFGDMGLWVGAVASNAEFVPAINFNATAQ